ncbi:Uncharacterised protein [Moraxella caviae]|uniref:Uncharacterized protein n=1 Tax=Moraxella caviae TaxID=34060 RepID=A0A378R5G1_9GAMM|nr:Uncharacterised protein [Moraxella caviae]
MDSTSGTYKTSQRNIKPNCKDYNFVKILFIIAHFGDFRGICRCFWQKLTGL